MERPKSGPLVYRDKTFMIILQCRKLMLFFEQRYYLVVEY